MENEFNEYVRGIFSEFGDIVIKSMMGGYLVYYNGKLIGDIYGQTYQCTKNMDSK